ncbi:MAG: type II toxin-antitoxin system RelE/ParE family toxin [Sphingobacteriaceae bacterium]|nr:MAG: type II toxin-antitoxin system RelE/ParE family toxin [Sphingobacteriaceae bacterium]
MAERTVVWTKTAAKQRREVLKYWLHRNRSAEYPERLINLITERINLILLNPEAFVSTSFPETRISAMGNFSILYKFNNDQLIITAFWDNRQDPEKLLKLLR